MTTKLPRRNSNTRPRPHQINWNVSDDDARIIERIVERIKSAWLVDESEDKPPFDKQRWIMDITACHLNGTPLKLKELADADNFTFFHDVYGIARHINRHTGRIEHHFLPRTYKGENT